jgi:hypothetical protein
VFDWKGRLHHVSVKGSGGVTGRYAPLTKYCFKELRNNEQAMKKIKKNISGAVASVGMRLFAQLCVLPIFSRI